MINLDEIRQRLIEVIRSSDMTLIEISRQLGIKHQTISQYISGRAMPALDTFANLCIVLDVDPAYILGYSDFGGGRVDNRRYTINTKIHKGNINIR